MINRRRFVLLSSGAALAALQTPAFGADAVKMVHAANIKVPDALKHAILDSPRRPADDKKRDAGRMPAETIAFFGIKPGMKVAELAAATGYFTAVLAEAVGETGTVYGQNNKPFRDYIEQESKGAIKRPLGNLIEKQGYKNIVEINSEMDDPKLPAGLDAVFSVMIYHDAVGEKWNAPAMNAAVFKALKPGGIYGIIDHRAARGAGITDVGKNHRIEEQNLVDEVKQAGFRLAEETDLLANPKDPLTIPVFAPEVRDHTDRFTLKFIKPA